MSLIINSPSVTVYVTEYSSADPALRHDIIQRLIRIEALLATEGAQMTSLGQSVDDLTTAVTDLHARFDQETQALLQAQADVKTAQDALVASQAQDAADQATIAQKQSDLDAANQAATDAASRIEQLVAELKALGQPATTPPDTGGTTPPSSDALPLYQFVGTGAVDPQAWKQANVVDSGGGTLYTSTQDTAGQPPTAATADFVPYTGPTSPAPTA